MVKFTTCGNYSLIYDEQNDKYVWCLTVDDLSYDVDNKRIINNKTVIKGED